MTKKWDCYSPVAMVLWRAADFAEAGSVSPIHDATDEMRASSRDRRQAWALVRLKRNFRFGADLWQGDAAFAIMIRNLAEFGPAGRRKAK